MVDFLDSVVLIETTDNNEEDFGTGFIVHRNERETYLVTCAHVISKKIPSSRESRLFEKIEVRGESLLAAEVEGWDNEFDLAILKVRGLYDRPILRLVASGQAEMPFITSGYYQFDKGQKNISQLQGKLLKPEQRIRQQGDRATVWRIEVLGNECLKPGNSGSPALDETGNYVLGVISNLQGEGQIGWMISIETLKQVWLEMPDNLISNSNSSPTAIASPPSHLTATERRYIQDRIEELETEYEFADEEVKALKKALKTEDLSPKQMIKVKRQIAEAEAERDEFFKQIDLLKQKL
ncbi:MAG: serine protease [Spirulina sp.]